MRVWLLFFERLRAGLKTFLGHHWNSTRGFDYDFHCDWSSLALASTISHPNDLQNTSRPSSVKLKNWIVRGRKMNWDDLRIHLLWISCKRLTLESSKGSEQQRTYHNSRPSKGSFPNHTGQHLPWFSGSWITRSQCNFFVEFWGRPEKWD